MNRRNVRGGNRTLILPLTSPRKEDLPRQEKEQCLSTLSRALQALLMVANTRPVGQQLTDEELVCQLFEQLGGVPFS